LPIWERQGGAVPESDFRSAGFDVGEDLADLGVHAARFLDPDVDNVDQFEGAGAAQVAERLFLPGGRTHVRYIPRHIPLLTSPRRQ
jgi:hypothetical protein